MDYIFKLVLLFIITACSTDKIPETEITRKQQERTNYSYDQYLEILGKRKMKQSVVLLLPLTGTNAKLGQNILQAAIIANQDPNLDIYPINTNDFSEEINIDNFPNLKAVIGPVFFSEAHRFATIFQSVPIFSLSNNENLNNGHIYACGLSPQEELRTIFSYCKQNKINSMELLLPKGIYYDNIANIIQQIGEKYGFDEDSINLVRYNNISEDEISELIENCGKKSIFICEPIINISNINIPVFSLSSIVLSHPYKWNGVKFAYTDSKEKRNFVEKYFHIFKEQPTVISLITADIIKLINARPNENFLTKYIEFEGLLGNFELKKDKGLNRNLHIFTINNGEKQDIELMEEDIL